MLKTKLTLGEHLATLAFIVFVVVGTILMFGAMTLIFGGR